MRLAELVKPVPLVEHVVSRMTYKPGWTFEVNSISLIISTRAPDRDTGDEIGLTSDFLIPTFLRETSHTDNIVAWVQGCIYNIETHEADEFFKVDVNASRNPMDKCEHPECDKDSCGATINGAPVCLEHVDWAMGKAFKPIKELLKKVDEDGRS